MALRRTQPRIRVKWQLWLSSGRGKHLHLRTRTFPWTQEGYDKALALYEELCLDTRGAVNHPRLLQPKPWKYGIPNKKNGPTPKPSTREIRPTPVEVSGLHVREGRSEVPEGSSPLCRHLRVDRLEVSRPHAEGIKGEMAFRLAERLRWAFHRV